MGAFFADIHASAESQLGHAGCTMADSPEVAALRGAREPEQLLQLAQALSFQLRYLEAADICSQAIALVPRDIRPWRLRAARHLSTLQIEKAISDFLECRTLGGDEMDISYRLGLCYYLAGRYADAMAELSHCLPLCDDEMGVAVIFWHTLSAWRANRIPTLLYRSYHGDMQVGHHTAYDFAMRVASEQLPLSAALIRLDQEQDDLEFSIMAYGVSEFMKHNALATQQLTQTLLRRDSFWISYCYIAAWNDTFGKKV